MMLYPSVQQLTNDKMNRYSLVIAAAKGARILNERALAEREENEHTHDSKDYKVTYTADAVNIKAVSQTIERIQSGEFKVIIPDVK